VFISLMDTAEGHFAPMTKHAFTSIASGGRHQGVHPDAARPDDVRDDDRHSADPVDAVWLRLNSNPKHLPTAVYAADNSQFSRHIVWSLRNSSYFDITRDAHSEDEIKTLLAEARSSSP